MLHRGPVPGPARGRDAAALRGGDLRYASHGAGDWELARSTNLLTSGPEVSPTGSRPGGLTRDRTMSRSDCDANLSKVWSFSVPKPQCRSPRPAGRVLAAGQLVKVLKKVQELPGPKMTV